MLPAIKGYSVTPPWRGFSYGDVLDYYDGPRLLLERGPDGQRYLVWWNDNDDAVERWICLPVSKQRAIAICSGRIPARAAMEQPEDGSSLLVVDIDLDTAAILRAVKTAAAAIPQDSLPHPEATLDILLPESLRDGGSEKIDYIGSSTPLLGSPAQPHPAAGVAASV